MDKEGKSQMIRGLLQCVEVAIHSCGSLVPRAVPSARYVEHRANRLVASFLPKPSHNLLPIIASVI